MSDSLESELIFACAGAFLASFAAHLWAIGRNPGTSADLGTALAAAGDAAVIQYFRGDLYSQSLIALFGLALATMVAAHLRRRRHNGVVVGLRSPAEHRGSDGAGCASNRMRWVLASHCEPDLPV
jgi:hypothetical protein